MTSLLVLFASVLVFGAVAQAPDEGYSREQLQPLTKYRCAFKLNSHDAMQFDFSSRAFLDEAAAQEDGRAALSTDCPRVELFE